MLHGVLLLQLAEHSHGCGRVHGVGLLQSPTPPIQSLRGGDIQEHPLPLPSIHGGMAYVGNPEHRLCVLMFHSLRTLKHYYCTI